MNSYQRRIFSRAQRRFSVGDGVKLNDLWGTVKCSAWPPNFEVGVLFTDGTYQTVREGDLQSWPEGNKGKYGGRKNNGSPEAGHKYGKDKRRLHGGRTTGVSR